MLAPSKRTIKDPFILTRLYMKNPQSIHISPFQQEKNVFLLVVTSIIVKSFLWMSHGMCLFAIFELTGIGRGQDMLTLVHAGHTPTPKALSQHPHHSDSSPLPSTAKPLVSNYHSTNHINYTNPWKTDHFTSTWLKPPFSHEFRHKKLLTQCDSDR